MQGTADWIASGIAAFAAVISILAWLEARRLRADTAETAKVQTRAYITAETCKCANGPAGGGMRGVAIELLNSGQTPTLSYSIDVAMRLITVDPDRRELWHEAPGDDYFAVLPGTVLPGARAEAVYTFSAALCDKTRAINAGEGGAAVLIVHGAIRYMDIYRDTFTSPFHFEAVIAPERHMPGRLLGRAAGAPFQPTPRKPSAEQGREAERGKRENFEPGDL